MKQRDEVQKKTFPEEVQNFFSPELGPSWFKGRTGSGMVAE